MLNTTILLGQEGLKVKEAKSHIKPHIKSITNLNIYFNNFNLIFKTQSWRSYNYSEKLSFRD